MDEHSLECLDFPRVRELLAQQAMTGLGRRLAGAIQPIARPELVERWFRQFDELQRLVDERGLPPLAGITDVRELVAQCAPPLRVTVEDVARIGDALAGTHAVTGYLANLPESMPELAHLATRIGDFATVADRIKRVIGNDGQVRDDASPKLARLRAEIVAATDQIREAVSRLLHDPDIRRLLQYANHTFHNDRLVLPVRTEYRGRLPGIIHRTSDSGATIYIEPSIAVELNNRISDLRIAETEEVNRLLWELTHEIYLNATEITRTLDTLAVLDLVAAKVRMARTYDLRCPALLPDSVVQLRQARHPLLVDLARQRTAAGQPFEVVPIDVRLGDDFDLLVITGPNTGGKTVTLKTVGLLLMMVQAGLPIPVADGSRVGLFTNVLIDIGDEQSMQQSLSTFSGHMQRLLDMLKRAGPRTLVLIDELGAGTDPDEGAAIGRALLDELLRLGGRCIVTTHIGALKSFALTRERAENGCVEFDGESLRPTYHLRIGEAGSSNAIEIAQRLGMPKRLVVAARRNLSHRARALRSALAGAETVKRQAEQARQAAESAMSEAERRRVEAEATRTRLEQQQADFQEWVRRVAHLQPGDAVRVRNFDHDGKIVRVRLDQQRAEVDVGAFTVEVPLADVLPPQAPAPPPPPPKAMRPTPPKPPRPPKAAPPRPAPPPQRREPRAPPPLPSLTEQQAKALRPGDAVYAKRFNRQGSVVRVNESRKLAVVSIGLLEVEVPFDGLALPPSARQADLPRRPKRPPPPAAPTPAPVATEAPVPSPAAAETAAPAATTDTPPDAAPPASAEPSALPPAAE